MPEERPASAAMPEERPQAARVTARQRAMYLSMEQRRIQEIEDRIKAAQQWQ
jgi:hypothetical protein